MMLTTRQRWLLKSMIMSRAAREGERALRSTYRLPKDGEFEGLVRVNLREDQRKTYDEIRFRLVESDIEVTVAEVKWYVLAYLNVSHEEAILLQWLIDSHKKK